ncbi:MAG: hypothetical protein HYX78_12435 [Armatimonadetes bacterium]|nr:hypothetical protein [Armatimonadota bacterium]
MRVEEEYMDVLQNIEFAIVGTYRKRRDLSDYDVMRALEALIDAYSGEKIGRPPRSFGLSDLERELADQMRQMCEWRLGRTELQIAEPSKLPPPGPKPVTVDEIIICLKRILNSAKRWNKEQGRQGYLDYVSQFIV